MKKTKTQQFSKFFIKDLKTKKPIFIEGKSSWKVELLSWNHIFLIDKWRIYRSLLLILLYDNSTITYNYFYKDVYTLVFLYYEIKLKNVEKQKTMLNLA